MKHSETDRIVIRRKRPVHAAHSHGAWKIAYADYMTAMMSFFLIMWILSLVPRDDLVGIAEYFRMPLMTAVTGGPKVDTGSTVIPGGAPSPIPNRNPITHRTTPHNPEARAAEVRSSDARAREALAREEQADRLRLEDLKQELETLIQTDPVLREFRPQLLLDMTPDGLRVQIVDQQNRPMFATGSAQVQPYMRTILRELGPVFNKLPNSVTVSGHTDAVQYASGERLYSNWELSADRANAARQELVAGGMSEKKIKRILGLSSSVSLIKDNPNAAVNRRISLVVLNKVAERRIDEQNAPGPVSLQMQGDALLPVPGTGAPEPTPPEAPAPAQAGSSPAASAP